MDIYVKNISKVPLSSLVFKNDFITCVDFNCIAASNIASDDVTNQVTHRICSTDL